MSQLKLAFKMILLSLLFIFGMSVTCNLTHQMVCYTEPSVTQNHLGSRPWKLFGKGQALGR